MKINKSQLILIVAISLLTIVIYVLPIAKTKSEETNKVKNNASVASFEDYESNVKSGFRPAQLITINSLEERIKTDPDNLALYDTIGIAWDGLNQPAVSAHYFELKALKDNKERSYIDAAYRYFDAFKMTEDTLHRGQMVEKAIFCYEKVLIINPNNLNAKTDLGVCYAEGTGMPMKGIMLLREVIKEDPNHENAQLNLGFLSLKSTQYDKAIDRFNIVLKINPSRTETYIYLSQTYLQMGDTASAKANLKTFITKTKDEAAKKEAINYLQQIGG